MLPAHLLGALSQTVQEKEYEKVKSILIQDAPQAGLLPRTCAWTCTYTHFDASLIQHILTGVKPAKNLLSAKNKP